MKELIEFLELLGLTDDEIKVYIFLLQQGASTILQASKGVHINRTALYRLCERLTEKGYLKKIPELHTTKYEASSVEFLKTKIQSRREHLRELEINYGKVKDISKRIISLASTRIKVIHYSGKEEVRQLLWNTLEAKPDILSLGYRTLAEAVGSDFNKRWWYEIVRLNIPNKIIVNPGTLKMKDAQEEPGTRSLYEKQNPAIWQPRVISRKTLIISQETFIYNDIYSLIQWDENKVFGVEIYNKVVADQEREIFKVLWKIAQPV
jgi:predicted transcriptional regulator